MRNSTHPSGSTASTCSSEQPVLQQKVTNWTLSDLRMVTLSLSASPNGSPTRETEPRDHSGDWNGILRFLRTLPNHFIREFGDSSLLFTRLFLDGLISNRDNRVAVSEVRHTDQRTP